MKHKILKIDENIETLHKESERVIFKRDRLEIESTILGLKRTAKELGSISAISAPQIGVNKRIIVINVNGSCTTYINPMIDKAGVLCLSRENCASCGDSYYYIPRYKTVDIFYTTPSELVKGVRLSGILSILFQQQYDILAGLLLSDGIAIEETEEIRQLDGVEREKAINQMFIDIKRID